MKRLFTSFLGAVCLFALSACSDEETPVPQPGGSDTEELPALPSEVIKDGRAMWVSYDPTPDAVANSTTFIHGALVSWRLLQSDPSDVAFDIYKSVDGGQEVKLNGEALLNSTCFLDENIDATKANHYRVTLSGSTETVCECDFTPEMAQTYYRKITLNANPSTIELPESGSYVADDIQVGELDGDGEMEIVIKREPYDGANQGGWHSGTTLLEAYKLDGTFLWRIDLGVNIRSGSHYTSYILYDFDGDGLCEIAFRSAEGTQFADGKMITGEDGKVHDYRIRDLNGAGWASGAKLPTTCGLIFEGPEYISICRGYDGREIARTDNIPRGGEGSKVARAEYWGDYWGDDYGNRMDRFFIGAAYLDGIPDPTTGARTSNPSLIVTRGVYKNWQVWAFDLKGSELENRWKFDTKDHDEKWLAMCSHAFRVADLDNDGKDEVLYGQAAIDDNGNELWCTGNGHGDCLHVGKFIKDRDGLQIVASFEEENTYSVQGLGYGCQVIDARDGSLISAHGAGKRGDVGRCIVADVDPDSPNMEYWSSMNSGMYNCGGPTDVPVSSDMPTGIGGGTLYNAAIWWSGELTRELFDRALIVSYNANPRTDKNRLVNFATGYGSNQGNHSTKYNPCYYGDFLGDWREEVIMGSPDQSAIYIFSTNYPTEHRFPHLMTDHTYDMSQAMQNIGYNQPTHLGYYIGNK
ncbi:hypothetical protein [Phocaeicola plebeius]|uniref:rhamnogalacturonan lyase family protein n=1 Tax=Phocaeicola plebeius TaxID=310297 RepID=UPI00352254DA